MSKVLKCDIVRVWSDGREERFPGRIDVDDGSVWSAAPGYFPEESVEESGEIVREYVTFGDGGLYEAEVCAGCHGHVVGPLGDTGESYGCPGCDGGELEEGWLRGLLGDVLGEYAD